MNPFNYVRDDYPLHNLHQNPYSSLFVIMDLAGALYSSGYSGGRDYRAYQYVLDWLTARYGAEHHYVRFLAIEFNRKASSERR